MRLSFYLIGVLCATIISGCAEKPIDDSPQQRKILATEISQLTLSDGGFDTLRTQAIESAMQVFSPTMQAQIGRELTQSEYEKFRKAFEKAFDEVLPSKVWLSPTADLYAKHFDSNELNEILIFYRTPIGRKSLRTMNTLAIEGAQMGIELMESKEEEFGRVFEREVQKIVDR